MKVSDTIAKLLANENLTIIRASDSTAYFDTSTRVLSIPNWKEMSDELEVMFIAHEVGHALYTHHDEWTTLTDSVDSKIRRTIKGYFNCIEDARIERNMKERYPGLRKTFFSGYKELMARDFFRIGRKDVNKLTFIDRLNIHFKVGYSAGIKFNAAEMVYIRKTETIQSVEDAFNLALECYEFAKTQQEEQKIEFEQDGLHSDEDESEEDEDESEEDEGSSFDYNEDEEDESEDGDDEDSFESSDHTKSSSESNNEEDLESITDKALNENLEDLADTSTEYRYYQFVEKMFRDPTVTYKTIISETDVCDKFLKQDSKMHFESFMKDSERVVNYLVKEFEMRKSATAYARTTIAKSGSLNTNKLYAHTLTDDIFKRISRVPTGKNHGMIFLLDWSGSMSQNIESSIKQLINLVMFCRRINIPFEVYAFSSDHAMRKCKDRETYLTEIRSWMTELASSKDKNVIFSNCNFSLLNFFSSKMSNSEFNVIAKRMLADTLKWAEGYGLNCTPLNDALLHMLKYIPMYKRANNIEKLSLVTLTDGASGQLYSNKQISPTSWNSGHRVKVKNFVQDNLTNKTYELINDKLGYTDSLLQMITHRYDVDTIGMFLSSNHPRQVRQAHIDNVGSKATEFQIEQIRHEMKREGFFTLPSVGYKELFLINDIATKITDEKELSVDANSSAASIARQMTRNITKKRECRIVLDKFIGHVA